jgi:hypothetical protein
VTAPVAHPKDPIVTALRLLLRSHAGLAAFVVAMALAVRILVPAGFMPTLQDGSITVTLCDGYGPAKMTMPMPGMEHHEGGQMQQRCAFADLALPALGGADPIQLAAAIAFLLLAAFFAVPAFDLRRARNIRPPLRGPPLPR